MSDALPPFQRFLDAHRDAVWRFLRVLGRAHARPRTASRRRSSRRCAPIRACAPDSNLRAWVLTIAHRKALDAHRARARRALPVGELAASTDGAASRLAPARDEALWEAVGELPARQRSAVVLRYVADLPHREIATAIGCSEEAARRSLHEGLTKLRKVVPA